ncbi:MAG: DUF1643 domain-containing protein [Microcoleaceae cyanobacterium]
MFAVLQSSATFDPTRQYRYLLWRGWDVERPPVTFVMLNPSQADEQRNDPTLRRCIKFAQTWGYGSLTIVNLFAYCVSCPQGLKQTIDPVGPENNTYLLHAFTERTQLILAWGNQGLWLNRSQAVLKLMPQSLQPYCLGVTQMGQPRHPLYLNSTAILRPHPKP